MKLRLKQILALSSALGLVPVAAFAQADAGANASSSALGEIVVTATRRATDLQRVTATVNVATAEKLAATNIKNAQGLERIVPGVVVTASGGLNAFLRGIGASQAGFNEGPVGFYIDGIYLPTSAAVLMNFSNIDRVELLKGPQGTLYGRNTTGGLINVVTRAPSEKATLDASLGYGNFNTFTQNFYASGPIAPKLKASLAVYHQKQADGWSRNVITGHDVQKSEETGAYAKLEWDPTSNTKITLSDLYSKTDTDKGFAYAVYPGTFGLDGSPYVGKWKISSRLDPATPHHSNMTSFRIDHDFGSVKLFSLTAYQTAEQTDHLNQNGIVGQPRAGQSAQLVYVHWKTKTTTQELQLSSNTPGAKFDWILGAFYFDNSLDVQSSVYQTCVGSVCAPGPGGAPPTFVSTSSPVVSYSGYGDGTFHVTPRTHLTAGVRYTYEKDSYSGLVTPFSGVQTPFGALPNAAATLPPTIITTPGAAGVPPFITANKLTYRAVLAHDFADTVHGYVSYNKGFRSGIYNQLTLTQKPVRPEQLVSYEAGLKSEIFDRRARINLAAFYYDYTNTQVRTTAGLPQGSQPVSQNAGAAKITGLDAEFEARATDRLTILGGVEFLDAHWTKYPGATCVVGPVIPSGTVLGGLTAVPCDQAGLSLPLAPKVSYNLGVSYTLPTAAGPVVLFINDSYKSSKWFVGYDYREGPHHLVDASVTWTAPSKRYFARAYVTNLTNEYTYQAVQAATNFAYVPGAPRSYGVTVGYHF